MDKYGHIWKKSLVNKPLRRTLSKRLESVLFSVMVMGTIDNQCFLRRKNMSVTALRAEGTSCQEGGLHD